MDWGVFAISDLVLSSFIRVVTHPRIFKIPSPVEDGMECASEIRELEHSFPVSPRPRHWKIFSSLCRESEARGEPGSRRLPRRDRNRIGSAMGNHGRRLRAIPGTALEKTAPSYALTTPVSSTRLAVVLPRDPSLQCAQGRKNWDAGFLLHTDSTWQLLFDSIDGGTSPRKLGGY